MSKERFAELMKSESSLPDDKAPGITVKELLGKAWDEMSHIGAQGSQELAAAIFSGSAFVLYPGEGKQPDAPEHGLHGEAAKQPEQEMERGGRE